MELELCLDPDDAARLSRLPLLAPLRSGRAQSRAVRIVWHDSPDRELAEQGLALAEQRPQWRLERLLPAAESWPPGAPAPVIATARDAAGLGTALPGTLLPMAAFEGRATARGLATEPGPVTLTLLTGALRTIADEHPVGRLRIEGADAAVQALALALADEIDVAVPRAGLAAEALAVATGTVPAPRRLGAPELPAGLSVAEAFAHVVGHLADVILWFAPLAAAGRDGPEPVHQMRVAVRRLRSAIQVFRRAVRCPAVDDADAGLKALAARLGPTRDWDVFVTETAATAEAAFPAEPRLQRLLAAAGRRRRACHDELREFLASGAFRRLGIELACLAGGRDWLAAPDAAAQVELAAPLRDFAADVLVRRLAKLAEVEDDLTRLEPAALHRIRLSAKRMRYAAEVFVPLYSGKATARFIRRLSRLQDVLGTLNDGSVAAGLLGELSGGNHGFACGLILGFVGAHGGDMRGRIAEAWQKFHRQEPFWE